MDAKTFISRMGGVLAAIEGNRFAAEGIMELIAQAQANRRRARPGDTRLATAYAQCGVILASLRRGLLFAWAAIMSERKRLWETMDPSEIERDALVGMALGHIQSVEATLKLVMTFVFQKGDKLDIFILEAQTKAEQRKTLGYFIGELRKRVGLRPDLEEKLLSFLERRNIIAHRLDEVPGWEEGPEAGFDETAKYLAKLMDDTHELLLIFSALVHAWQKQVMPDAKMENDEVVSKMTEGYKPLLDDLFFTKE